MKEAVLGRLWGRWFLNEGLISNTRTRTFLTLRWLLWLLGPSPFPDCGSGYKCCHPDDHFPRNHILKSLRAVITLLKLYIYLHDFSGRGEKRTL